MPRTGSTSSISLTISTSRGPVHGRWSPAALTRAAAILLPDWSGSSASSYPLFDELAGRIQLSGVSALQLEPCSGTFDERLACLLSMLISLRRQGVERVALIGWHTGASLAIAAGSVSDSVTGVAALAPDSAAADMVADVAPRRLLLLHGSADTVAPAAISRMLYARADDPRELVIFPGELHDFSVFHDEAIEKLTVWARTLLRCPFKPCKSRRDSLVGREATPFESSDPVAISTAL